VSVTAQIISYESELIVTSTQMEEELTFSEQNIWLKYFAILFHILQRLVPYNYADTLLNHDQSNQLASS